MKHPISSQFSQMVNQILQQRTPFSLLTKTHLKSSISHPLLQLPYTSSSPAPRYPHTTPNAAAVVQTKTPPEMPQRMILHDWQVTKMNGILAFVRRLWFCHHHTAATVVHWKTSFPSNHVQMLWYSTSAKTRPWSKAYKKRVNRRARIASKPVLDRTLFDEAVSQLPARFTAPDLHQMISAQSDPLVCLELFRWAETCARFKHSVHTYHVTIQKLGHGGMMDEMYDLVDQLLDHPDIGSEPLFNTVIHYFTRARKLSRAITVFKHMKKLEIPDCRPSLRTYKLLLAAFLSRRSDTYINHMYMGTMESLFRQMVNDGIRPDIFSLNYMIDGYVLSNHVNDALHIFHQMEVMYSCAPGAVTYDHLIHGLCAQGRTNNARDLFVQMKSEGFVSSAKTYNSLVNASALGGEIEQAVQYLWEMIEKQMPVDFITYRTLLDEFCRRGKVVEALNLLKELKDKRLFNEAAFRNLLLVIRSDLPNSRISSHSEHRGIA